MKYIFFILISLFVKSAVFAANMESDTLYYYQEYDDASEA